MNIIKYISELILPFLIVIFFTSGIKNKINVYKEFSNGMKESIKIIYDIFPAVASLMVAIGMLRGSGLLDGITNFLSPLFIHFNIPQEILPMAILRPMSGSGGIAMLDDIIKNFGADSIAGITASVICGSTETTFYTLAVYFGSVDIENTRHTVLCALVADFVGIISGIIICRLMFV